MGHKVLHTASASHELRHTTGSVSQGTQMRHITGTVSQGTQMRHTTGSVSQGTQMRHTIGSVSQGTQMRHITGSVSLQWLSKWDVWLPVSEVTKWDIPLALFHRLQMTWDILLSLFYGLQTWDDHWPCFKDYKVRHITGSVSQVTNEVRPITIPVFFLFTYKVRCISCGVLQITDKIRHTVAEFDRLWTGWDILLPMLLQVMDKVRHVAAHAFTGYGQSGKCC